MTKTEELDQLFERWIAKQNAKGEKSFCKDGIVNEEVFSKEKTRLLIISNESNDGKKSTPVLADRRIAFRDYFSLGHDNWRGKLRERCCEMYKLLTDQKEMPTNEAALHFAFMNLNKQGGGEISNVSHIAQYCDSYKNEILEEIRIIDPDIIIWSGLKTISIACNQLGVKEQDGVKTLCVNGRSVPVIATWHTSYYRGKNEPLPGYSNRTVGKLMKKLNDELVKAKWKA